MQDMCIHLDAFFGFVTITAFRIFCWRICPYYFATEWLFIRIPLDLLEGVYSTPFGFLTYDQVFRTYPISKLASACTLFSW